eukprot:RCo003642
MHVRVGNGSDDGKLCSRGQTDGRRGGGGEEYGTLCRSEIVAVGTRPFLPSRLAFQCALVFFSLPPSPPSLCSSLSPSHSLLTRSFAQSMFCCSFAYASPASTTSSTMLLTDISDGMSSAFIPCCSLLSNRWGTHCDCTIVNVAV